MQAYPLATMTYEELVQAIERQEQALMYLEAAEREYDARAAWGARLTLYALEAELSRRSPRAA